MDKRFTKENIEQLVRIPKGGNIIRSIAGYLIDFVPLFAPLFAVILKLILIGLDMIFFWILLFMSIGVSAVTFYYLFIKFQRIRVNKYQIGIEGLKAPVTFVFLSDLHIGREWAGTSKKRLQRIINKINELNRDLVILGGDFICDSVYEEKLKPLSEIKARYKIGVYGNHDASILADSKDPVFLSNFLKAISDKGIEMLINEGKLIELNGQKIFWGGISDLYSKDFDINKAFEKCPSDVNSRILLSHNPDIIDFVEEGDNIDLILSGHNHSGQIFIKPIGPILPMPTKKRWLTSGIFTINKRTKMLLTQGVGCSGSRIRLGTDNEICEVTLVPVLSS